MSYIGNPIVSTDFPKDTFSGNGSTTAFTMSIAPASVNAVMVIVSGVTQDPSTYTISGTTLTFSAAPPSGTDNISVRHLGIAGIPNTPSAGSVVTSSIADSSITPAKMANGGAEFGMRNRIINGSMVIDQRNAGASGTAVGYTIDRWGYDGAQASKITWQQNAGSVTPPVGFTNYLGATSLSAYTVGASESFTIQQGIEGYNIADLGWGTADAKTVTLSFWVRSSLTGTFGAVIQNNGNDRTYPFSYTISAANTWEQKSITIAGDTTGTWLTTNQAGLKLRISLGCGSSLLTTANSWAAGNYRGVTGQVNIVGTSGATFYITGVQLEVGSSATGFEYRQYQQELALCQRYYYKTQAGEAGSRFAVGYNATTTTAYATIPFLVTMRTNPTALEQTGTATDYSIAYLTSTATCSAVPAFSNGGVNFGMVTLTVASGLTAGQGCQARAVNTNAYLAWSAEL